MGHCRCSPTAGTGYGPKIGQEQNEKIPVFFGTARCDGGLGLAMPTGRYNVVVYMHPETPVPVPSTTHQRYHSWSSDDGLLLTSLFTTLVTGEAGGAPR